MTQTPEALTTEQFKQAIIDKGQYYHIYHPFHVMMYEGKATQQQIQAWVANRYYYQINIPLKDAAIMANCPDQRVRQEWIQRMIDQDGEYPDGGGREAWLRLAEAVGLSREQVISEELVLPGVRFAVDAYVNFARRASWREAASSSLTELFAPQIHQSRLESWPQHYPWIDDKGYEYFRSRLSQARRDVEHGLTITLDSFTTHEQQQRMLEICKIFFTVAPDGMALPCHAARQLPISFPNVREQSLSKIWYESTGFNHFRGNAWMPEGCRSCPDKDRDFGGCRCQAYMLTGDASNADPVCGKSPYHQFIEQARAESEIDSSLEKLVFRNSRNSKQFTVQQNIPVQNIVDD